MNAWHWRAVLYGSFLIACLVVIWPPYTRNGEPGKIKLGLDLRGGTYLVLQVMGDDIPAAGKAPVAPGTGKEGGRPLGGGGEEPRAGPPPPHPQGGGRRRSSPPLPRAAGRR